MNPDTAPVALPPSYMVHLQPTDSHGHMLAGVYFSGAILSGVAIVVQMYMVASVLSVFFGTPKDLRRARLLVVLTSVAILVTSTTDTLFDIFSAFRILFHGGPDGKSYIAAFANDFVANKHLYLSSDAVSVVTIAIGDLLMLWRCFMLWNDSKWIVALPCLAGFGSIVTQIAYLIPPLKGGEAVLAASLSVAMNIMITFLILLKLGLTWRRASQAFPDQKRPPMYGNIAAIIIESATPLAFFGIAYITVIAVYVWHAPQNFTVEILRRMFGWLYHTFCALSPQMIIFRVTVATSRSQTDSEESSVQVHDKMGLFSQPIRFTHTAASDNNGELASTEGADPVVQSKWV